MQVYRYWARAYVDDDGRPSDTHRAITGVGWSDLSEQDAADHALARAQRIHERLRRGEVPEYEDYYADRPLREPVVDDVVQDGHATAVITRNVYGAYVLNTADLMFIDIDTPASGLLSGALGRLFGKRAEPDDTPQRVADVVRRHPGMGLRLYRTPAGYRGVVTHRPYDPAAPETTDLLHALDADRLYVRLCRAQSCFRARLTPKPWRIGMPNPPRGYPWPNDAARRLFDDWSAQYEKRILEFAACEFVEALGHRAVHPSLALVLKMHDELACTGGPLA